VPKDTHRTAVTDYALLELPKQVTLAVAELAGAAREGLLALPVGTGLRSTNSVESMIEICRDHMANVKRWRDGQMVLRWIAAGMNGARKQFRRQRTPTPTRPAGRTRPDDRHRRHTNQGGCRRLITRRAATEVPRNLGHPPVDPGQHVREARSASSW
jgi:hypothetical protein